MGRGLNLNLCMPALTITTIWILLWGSPFQTLALSEKQAVASVQTVLASELDGELASRPFAEWFRQLVGPQAGVSWQLNECGERPSLLLAHGRELPACVEVDALLPNGRKVVVMIEVGTFKKGITGNPRFYHAAIEQQGELHRVRRLRDLPACLREPATLAEGSSTMPALLYSNLLWLAPGVNGGKALDDAGADRDAPPPPGPKPAASPPPLRGTQSVSEGMVLGNVISRAQPLYPASAKKMNASGKVEVQVTISVAGRVIEAAAISGHPLLRRAAVEAAGKWVFKPTILNDVPVQVKSILTFVFAPSQ